jgi:hypothetical protein
MYLVTFFTSYAGNQGGAVFEKTRLLKGSTFGHF